MRINNLTGTAFAASVVSIAGDSAACTTEVAAISPSDPLGSLVKCAAKLSVTGGTTYVEYMALYEGCVTALANEVGSSFPSLTVSTETDCRSCYSTFADDVAAILAGSVSSGGTFIGATSAVAVCATMATPSEIDECLKTNALIEAMISFQSCSGHAINYPANADLARERVLFRADAFVSLTQDAFGNGAALSDALQDVIVHNAVVGATMQTGGDLDLDICFLQYYTELSDYFNTGTPDQSVIDACETIDITTSVCADTTPVADALTNFTNCAGYDMQVLAAACTADEANSMWQSDAYAEIVNCIFNDSQVDPSTDCANARAILNAGFITEVGADCAACYVELGLDIQASYDLDTTYGTNCTDPYSSDCKIRTGLAAVTNFVQCSGQTLDRDAPVTTTVAPATTTVAPATTAASTTTAPATTAAAATSTVAPTTTKSSVMAAPLATMVLLAIGSALVL